MTLVTQAKNVICKNETCLDGYYYLDGVCIPCNGCSKCIYEKISGKVRCLECGDSGDPNYNILLTPDGECHPCYIFSMCKIRSIATSLTTCLSIC